MGNILTQRPHDAASSSRTPSVARKHPVPCRPLRPESEDSGQMARAELDCSNGPIQLRKFGPCELDLRRSGILEHVGHLGCSGNGNDPRFWLSASRGDLGGSGLLPLGPTLQKIDECRVMGQVFGREP